MYKGLDVSGKVVLVTGGTSGIGRAIALGLAQSGAKVMAGSTNPEKVAAIKKELGEDHDAVPMDVSNEQSVADAVGATVKRFGRIDHVVNAAGVIKKQPSLEMPVAEFERIVRVNLTGSFIVAQLLLDRGDLLGIGRPGHHLRARLREPQRDRAADATGSAGDEDDLPGNVETFVVAHDVFRSMGVSPMFLKNCMGETPMRRTIPYTST